MPYTSRYGKKSTYKRRPAYRRRRYAPKRTVTSTKRIATIAKRVHYQNTEKKWRGEQITTFRSITDLGPEGSFLTYTCYELSRGDNNQSRDGRNVMSQGLQMYMDVSSNYDFPVHIRILLLRGRNPVVVPTVDNVVIDTLTKKPSTLTQYQRDMTQKIDTDLWRVLIDRKITLASRGSSSTGQIVGLSNWSRNIQVRKYLKTLLTYPLDEDIDKADPVSKNTHWVMIFAAPNWVLPIPAPDPNKSVQITTQRYHYFKDI